MFDILDILGNSSITLLRAGKVLAMGHDPFALKRGIRFFESGPCSTRCAGSRDKLY